MMYFSNVADMCGVRSHNKAEIQCNGAGKTGRVELRPDKIRAVQDF